MALCQPNAASYAPLTDIAVSPARPLSRHRLLASAFNSCKPHQPFVSPCPVAPTGCWACGQGLHDGRGPLFLPFAFIDCLTLGNITSSCCELVRRMFATSIKNPLEAETVGQRRERKAKEPEDSTRSSRSSFSARRETKSTKSSKFSVFEAFGKTPKTRVAPRDDRLESNVKQQWNVSPRTLPASPGLVPDSPSSVLWPHSQGYCELSSSPSVSKPKSITRCPRLYVVYANKDN
jgi:hypothetical protein